ncbi:MAG: tRNA (adenosine(37)-N6)-threonylcarbamoyltransferase complex dimerization subunit type 1 TsaB [Gammaproteobacteria bacterium]|nr:tRNA (adenosine(37)-N6)-threonylcarbamoyltransferase complex dimerization subunit type 1 TsaB [Gammaproteobacteria bacterium]
MNLLAIDTVTEACSVALLSNNDIEERYEIVPRTHTHRVLPMVDELLAQAGLTLKQLDGFVLDRGPGSFTGVRIGTSVVQGLAFATGLPVLPVSSLAALAQAGLRECHAEKVLSVIDARMGEVYWGFYLKHNDCMQIVGEEQVTTVDKIEMQTGEWMVLGSGTGSYATQLSKLTGVNEVKTDGPQFPRARDLLELARCHWNEENYVNADQAQPIYLRNNVAQKPKQK